MVRGKRECEVTPPRLRVVGEPAEPARETSNRADATQAQRAEAKRAAERLRLELELTQERLQMRRALVAKLVEEYKTRPARIPIGALRTALVDRDLTEEECERLRRTLAKVQSAKPRDKRDAGDGNA